MKHKRKKVSKATFIRQHPNLPPRTVVELGKKAGLTFSTSYVSNVRWADIGPPVRDKKKKPKAKPDEQKPVIRMSDIKIDKAWNARQASDIEVVDASYRKDVSTEIGKVSGEGCVRAFKALIIAIGTRVARQLIEQVEDETSKMFGRPPV